MKTEITRPEFPDNSEIIPRGIKVDLQKKIEGRIDSISRLLKDMGRRPTKKEIMRFMSSEEYDSRKSFHQSIVELAKKIILRLSEREREILGMRFGERNNSEYTMDEVAKHFGISKQYVKVVEDRALGLVLMKLTG